MTSARLRSGIAADAPAVLDLWGRADAQPVVGESAAALAALLARDPEALIVAEDEGRLLGTLVAAWDGWRGSFYRLAVDPEARRRGIATALLREGERRLCERGASRLSAIVAGPDAGALAFWRAAGYEQQSERERFVRNLGAG